MNISFYFILFMIYSFLGWVIEILCELKNNKRFVNRGFFIGPYCPIYGSAGILVTLLLKKYADDPIVLFVMSMMICSILEYITSFLMEKLFNARWWDYSEKKFSINGRIYLGTMIPFGLLGCFLVYVLDPFFSGLLNRIPTNVLNGLSIILFILFLSDIIISFIVISKVSLSAKKLVKDNTEEITRSVREYISNHSGFGKRLMKSFPNIKVLREHNNKK